MKEIKGDLYEWRSILCSWIGRINIVKMSILLKLNLRRFNVTLTKILAKLFESIKSLF